MGEIKSGVTFAPAESDGGSAQIGSEVVCGGPEEGSGEDSACARGSGEDSARVPVGK